MHKAIESLLRSVQKPKGETPFPEVTSYEYFFKPELRHTAYEFCKEFTKYLHKSKAKNVLILDRAARGAFYGIHEYWKEYFPGQDMPKIYFINPDAMGENIQSFVALTSVMGLNIFDALEGMTEGKGQEFAEKYKRLQEQKDERLVVFDTCTHSGRHLLPVMSMLVGQGFKNMRVVTANSPNYVSPIRSDARLDRNVKLHTHYPFGGGFDSMVKKGKSLVSERNDEADRVQGARLRSEMRQIIRDKGKK